MKVGHLFKQSFGLVIVVVFSVLNFSCESGPGPDPDVTYSLSGRVTSGGLGLSGVTISLSGPTTKTLTTGANGDYSTSGLSSGHYTVTPALSGQYFEPVSKSVNLSSANVSGVDFAEDLPPSIIINGPTAKTSCTTVSSSIEISGFASDDVTLDAVTWTNSRGGSGMASGKEDWTIANVALQTGDNVITVTATDVKGSASSDAITMVYNPDLEFLSSIHASPDVVFLNESTQLSFRVAIENNPNHYKNSVKLWRLDENNNPVSILTTLADDGNVSKGDDIASDGIYSGASTVSESQAGALRVRVSTDVLVSSSVVTAYSDIVKIPALAHLTDSQFAALLAMPDLTLQKFNTLKSSSNEDTAKSKTVEWLRSLPEVSSSGIAESGKGIWYVLHPGVLGGIFLHPAGTRGDIRIPYPPHRPRSSENVVLKPHQMAPHTYGALEAFPTAAAEDSYVGSNNVLIIGPYHTSFGSSSEGPDLETLFGDSDLPKFNVTTIYDDAADLEAFKTLHNYGIISIISHGDTFFNGVETDYQDQFEWDGAGAQVVILTQITATEDNRDTYERDMRKGRLAVTGGNNFAITPAFVSFYNESFPGSAVHAGSCRSLYNDTMASAFIAGGAKTYTGYTEYVASSYANNTAVTYWTSLVGGKTTSESHGDATTAWGSNDGGNPPAYFELRGSGDTKIQQTGIINGSFEENADGWTGVGDFRILAQLGPLAPTAGSLMSIISTGLGAVTDSSSEMAQTFAIPAGVTTLSFDYNVVSEEPMEWVGSSYDDQFEAALISPFGGTTIIAQESVNGSVWTQVTGINFYGGDSTTFMTGWKKVNFDVSAYAGQGAVTLKLRTWDRGDSIYDTAALIDNVVLK
jgi:hypothetical protein